MKYYIIAGEASGDLHGANLIRAIQEIDSNSEFRVWGGNKMESTGAKLVAHYKEMAFMGFVGVLKNISKILNRIAFCKRDISHYKPDALIFIDYSGFNLRIAKWAKSYNFKKFYYISPQVWASRPGRIKIIKDTIDQMFCILPFEKEFYAQHNFDVEFVGHPLVDEIGQFIPNENFRHDNQLDDRPIVALLPGSRNQELKAVLPVMASIISEFKDYQFVIACAPSINDEVYSDILMASKNSKIQLIRNQTYDLLYHAYSAIVTSGTATLETAMLNVPQVVVYKGSVINYTIAKMVITVNYISLVNHISKKEIVKELIQNDFNVESLKNELAAIMDNSKRQNIINGYSHLKELLGTPGAPSRTAQLITQSLQAQHSINARTA